MVLAHSIVWYDMKSMSITIEKEQLEWLEDQVREERFGSLSHGIRYALKELMKREKDDKTNRPQR